MKIAVRYYSSTGNTKKVAEEIAKAVGVEAMDIRQPLTEKVDLLFLGSAVYAAGVDGSVKQFIGQLEREKIGAVACFSTAALLPSTYRQVKKLLEAKGIRVLTDEFHCRGQFHRMQKGHPSVEDLRLAAEFARRVAGETP